MIPQNIIDALKSEKPILREKFGVLEIAVFGSHARGEEKKETKRLVWVHNLISKKMCWTKIQVSTQPIKKWRKI